MKNTSLFVSVMFIVSVISFFVLAAGMSGSEVSQPLGQIRPEASFPEPIIVPVLIEERSPFQLDEIVIVGRINRPPRHFQRVSSNVWKCGDWKESMIGGRYRDCSSN